MYHMIFLFANLGLFSSLSQLDSIEGERIHGFTCENQELDFSNDDSIVRVESDRIYVRPDRILIDENKMLLKTTANGLIPLLNLAIDAQGIYTFIGNIPTAAVYPMITCKNCGRVFCPTFFNQGKYPGCGTQN